MSQQATSLESRHEVERRFHDERMADRQIDDRDFYAVARMDCWMAWIDVTLRKWIRRAEMDAGQRPGKRRTSSWIRRRSFRL